jgi:SAM-dependent methyltransferase
MSLPAERIDTLPSQRPSCPVCSGVCARASLHTPHAYWRCTACHTAHLHPQPSPRFLDEFYEQFHRSADEGGLFSGFEQRTAADFPAKAQIVCRELGWPEGSAPEPPRVLDVGCGKGFFVRELSCYNVLAEGIDISRAAIQEGVRMGISGLHAGPLEDRTDWTGRFDAVTAWATLEHLPDPPAFLAEVRRVLRPNGLLFLDTGLAGDFVDRWAPGLIQWYDVPQHLFVFSRSGMERLLDDAGFALVRLDPDFERTPARRLVKRVRNRALALAGSAVLRLGLGAQAYQRLRMESKMPFGSLMLVVARSAPPP